MRIKKNEYYIPSKVCHSAQMLIIKMLRPDPSARPRVHEVYMLAVSYLFVRNFKRLYGKTPFTTHR